MIYLVSQSRNFGELEKFLKKNNKEYTYIMPNEKELNSLIFSKQYEGIFLSGEYRDYVKDGKDFIYLDNGQIKYVELLYDAFHKFIEDNMFDFNDLTILLLGSNRNARIVYKVLKDLFNVKVFIASITEDTMNLEAGDRRIKKVEIFNLKEVDIIINTTSLGATRAVHSSMLDGKNLIKSKMLIDLIYDPKFTSLLLRYKQKNSKIYSGLEIELNRYEVALNLILNNTKIVV